MSDAPELGIFMDSIRERVREVPASPEKTDVLNAVAERYTQWWNDKESLISNLPDKTQNSASRQDIIRIGDLAESLHTDVDGRVNRLLDRHQEEKKKHAKALADELRARTPQSARDQERDHER